jgi:RHS repeat-associated protein
MGRHAISRDFNSAWQRVSISELYERFTPQQASPINGPIQHIYRVYGGGRQVAQVTRSQTGTSLTDEEVVYLHDDHLGSTQVVTDSNGVVQRQSFSAFGDQNQTLAGPDVLTGFTGQQEDPDLGLVNMRGRMYDPRLARFLTPDPITSDPLSSQGLNTMPFT